MFDYIINDILSQNHYAFVNAGADSNASATSALTPKKRSAVSHEFVRQVASVFEITLLLTLKSKSDQALESNVGGSVLMPPSQQNANRLPSKQLGMPIRHMR